MSVRACEIEIDEVSAAAGMAPGTLGMRHYQSCCRDGLTGWIAPLTALFLSLHGVVWLL